MTTGQPPQPPTPAQAAANRKKVDAALEQEKLRLDKLRTLEEINNAVGIEKDLLEKQNKILEEQINLQKARENGDVLAAKAAQERIDNLEKEKTLLEERNELSKQGLAIGENYAKKIIAVNSEFLQLALKYGSAFEALKETATGFLGQFSSFGKIGTLALDKFIGTMKEQIGALDEGAASFVQATGASREFALAAFETRQELGLLGITGAEAVKVAQELYGSFNEFTQLSRTAQQDFTVLAGQINKLGGDAGGMAQIFTKVANVSISQTEENLRLVAGAADALGVPLSQMSNDIEGMGELFAKMGQAGLDTFLELSAAAKATGLSVQELYGIVSQYDTFEGASAAAGRLNMVLGGNLIDTYSLLSASEEERIALLQDALALSGQTFDEMDRFQRIEIADALGVSLEQAAQLFQTTRGEVEKTAAELMHAGMSQEELEQRTKDAATAMDKFSVLMGNLAIFVGPIVEGVNSIIDGFLNMTEGLGATGSALTVLIAGLGSAYLASKLFGVALGISFKTAAGAIAGSAPAISSGLGSIGAAAGGAAAGVGAFAGAVLAIGAAVGIAAVGMSFLVMQFKDMNAGEILASSVAMLSFAASAIALGGALFFLGSIGPLAVTGALILSATVGGIVLAINSVNETKVQSFASALSSLMDLARTSLTGTGVAGFIREINSALNELPDDTTKMVAFKTTADSLANLVRVSATVEEAQIENIKMIIDGISNSSGNENVGRLADAITSLYRGQQNSQGPPIVIELDGRTLGRWIDRRSSRALTRIAS